MDRGQAAHAASTGHFRRPPRHFGISAGGTQKLNNSSTDQRLSVTALHPSLSLPARHRSLIETEGRDDRLKKATVSQE